MKIDVKMDGMDALKARLRGLADNKIKVAAVAALNDAAYAGAQETKKTMAQVFDRPTPWVMGGVRYVKARKDRLESSIDFDQWGNKTNVTVAKVLQAEIYGGQRKYKRHEIALQRAGVLPSGMAIVPGPGAAKDQYGNMPGSQIVQIMAWFKSFGQQGYKANSTDKTRARLAKDKKNGTKGFEYFVLQKKHGKLAPGIYQRFTFAHGSAIKPVMFFVRMPTYKRRLDFYGIAEKKAIETFNRAFPMYLDKLLKERGL
jgi:hypothetical protein